MKDRLKDMGAMLQLLTMAQQPEIQQRQVQQQGMGQLLQALLGFANLDTSGRNAEADRGLRREGMEAETGYRNASLDLSKLGMENDNQYRGEDLGLRREAMEREGIDRGLAILLQREQMEQQEDLANAEVGVRDRAINAQQLSTLLQAFPGSGQQVLAGTPGMQGILQQILKPEVDALTQVKNDAMGATQQLSKAVSQPSDWTEQFPLALMGRPKVVKPEVIQSAKQVKKNNNYSF